MTIKEAKAIVENAKIAYQAEVYNTIIAMVAKKLKNYSFDFEAMTYSCESLLTDAEIVAAREAKEFAKLDADNDAFVKIDKLWDDLAEELWQKLYSQDVDEWCSVEHWFYENTNDLELNVKFDGLEFTITVEFRK